MPTTDPDYSVVVIGGGPAGALAALKLASAGSRVLVIDRERPTRTEAAEILAPEGRRILEEERIWHQVPADLIRPCSKMAAAWTAADPDWTSFAGHPTGYAWHIDRIRFDAWLLDRLPLAGVDVIRGTVLDAQAAEGGWRIAFRTSDGRQSASSRCLVLATGRLAHPLRLARRDRIDNLGLVAGLADPDALDPDALIVEAAPDGWWYSAPLVDGRLFTGWMTDFSLVSKGAYERAAIESLPGAPMHGRRIGRLHFTSAIGSAAWQLTPAAGPGWIAVGDAALARDPISGDGLTSALASARDGAAIVTRALQGDDSVWAEATTDAAARAADYRRRRLALYRAAAQRWPTSPFWRRFVNA